MAIDAWHRTKAVLAEALEQRPADRAAYLDEACGGDAALRAEVESLLDADSEADDFIVAPAFVALAADDERDGNLERSIGPYRLERLIGRGGMGSVYLARRVDHEFERQVAVKMIRRGMDSELLIRRFRHERQILASLDHPHIARLFDGGTTDDGLPYFVMEFVDGVPIDRFADERTLSTPDRLRLFLRVVDAVQHAHERQIVHRDLKPGNVLVTPDGQPKLLDFGIAKLLDPDADGAATFTSLARPMTPDYASPEQVRGAAITPATDVYALGLLLYELLTGHRPYRLATHTPDEVARVVCEQDPERPSAAVARTETIAHVGGMTETISPASVSATRDGSPARLRQRLHGALDEVVLKALRKDPGERYASAAALADDLRRYLDDQPVAASQGARWYRVARLVRRHRAALATAALVVVTIAVTAAAMGWFSPRPPFTPPGAAATEAAGTSRRSAAVLRFRSLSGQSGDAWLSTALAEMLATELGGGGQLRLVASDVVARAEFDVGGTPGRSPADAVALMRRTLAADYVVVGSFAVSSGATLRAVRLDLQVLRATGDPLSVAQTGTEADLFALVASTGHALRERLGINDNSPATDQAIRAALPQGVEATRLYAEGLERLRALDAVAARELFERAAAREPASALIQAGLASAWTSLGYDARAVTAAERAFDAATGVGREQRLVVEGQLHEARKDWPHALDVYRTLWGFFADNAEYGLRLASAQTADGKAADALVTVAALRVLPAPQSTDPRVDLVESEAASALGDFPHQLQSAQRAVARARALGSQVMIARASMAEGRSLYNQGQPADAVRALEEAGQAFTVAGDRAGLAGALNSLGAVVDDQGDTARAERLYTESLAASESVGDRRGMSSALNNLGILLKDHGRLAEARQMHERALAIRRDIGDRNWTAVSLNNIGVVLYELDRLAEAADYYSQSLVIAREIGDKRSEVRALHNLAIVQREAGDVTAARAGYEQAIPARAAVNDRRGGVMARVELGMVQLAQGEVEAARRTEEGAAALAREIPLAEGEAQATYQLAEIALAAGDAAAARRLHESALAMRQKLGQTRTVLESQVALGAVAVEEGRFQDAERLVQPALSPGREQALVRMHAMLIVARARLGAHDVAGARRALTSARALLPATERVMSRWALEALEARVEIAEGRPAQARTRLSALRRLVASKGLVMADLDTRLLLAEAGLAAGDPAARRDIAALASDAGARGATLIKQRAQQLGS